MEIGKLNSLAGTRAKTLNDSVLGSRPAVVSRDYRIANIDRLRILSAVAVALFHMCNDWPIARHLGTVGILVFLISLSVFVVNRPEPLDLAYVVRRKARRLLKPWLFWSVVYGAVVLVKVFHKNVPPSDAFHWTMLLTGTRIHLWFLPFAFVAAVLLVVIHRSLARVPSMFTILGAIIIGVLCVLVCSLIQSDIQPPRPLRQWILGAPAIFFGLAIGRITLLQRSEDRRNMYLLLILSMAALCAVIVVGCNGLWADYPEKFAIRYLVSVAAVCFALHFPGSPDPVSRKLASLSYGIYLVHPLVMVTLDQLGIATQYPLVFVALVLVISAAITDVLRRIPVIRQFV